MKRFAIYSVTCVLASALSIVSVFIERSGPEVVQYGNMCGANFNDPCYRPLLKGGFPFSFLLDSPGVSVENQLSFGEDEFSAIGLVFDIAFYFIIILLACHRSGSQAAGKSAEA